MSEPRKRKIAVLGSRSVGKSSLVVRYVEDAFVDSYYPTIENIFNKKIRYKNQEYECDIIDTAGQVSQAAARRCVPQDCRGTRAHTNLLCSPPPPSRADDDW